MFENQKTNSYSCTPINMSYIYTVSFFQRDQKATHKGWKIFLFIFLKLYMIFSYISVDVSVISDLKYDLMGKGLQKKNINLEAKNDRKKSRVH